MHAYIVVKSVYRHLCFVDPIPIWCLLNGMWWVTVWIQRNRCLYTRI